MKNVFLTLLLGAIFVACSPEKRYATELEEISGFNESLDSLNEIYATIKFDSLIAIQKVASQSEKMIKRHYNSDTISMDLAQRLQFIKSVRKSLFNIEIKKKAIKNEIMVLKDQFKNLESDIRNGILNHDQIKSYLAEEGMAYKILSDNISNLLSNQDKQLNDFYFAYPLVKDYIEIIKPKEDKE